MEPIEDYKRFYHFFRDISSLVHSCTHVDEVLELVVWKSSKELEAEGATVQIVNMKRDEPDVFAAYGVGEKYLSRGLVVRRDVVRDLCRSRKAVVIDDPQADPRVDHGRELEKDGIVMILDTRKRTLNAATNIDTAEIAHTSRMISNLTGYSIQFNKAIVGRNAFAHSSGIHTDGMLKDRTTYEIIDPTRIGLSVADSKVILGKTSGRHAFRSHLSTLGYELSDDELEGAFARFKELADKKAEITDDDLEALVADQVRTATEVYKLEYIDTRSGTERTPTAIVRLRRNGDIIEKKASGDGQVDASCRALEEATGVKAKLLSYQVSAISGSLDAQGDVNVQLEIEGRTFLGRGVDTDIVAASARAYLNAINKYVSWQSNAQAARE